MQYAPGAPQVDPPPKVTVPVSEARLMKIGLVCVPLTDMVNVLCVSASRAGDMVT